MAPHYQRDRIGEALGHPIHPMFVHFPIALLVVSLIFDLLSPSVGPEMAAAAFFTLVAGLIGGGLAAVAGVYDLVVHDAFRGRISRIAFWHLGVNVVAVLAFFASLLLRVGRPYGTVLPTAPLVLSATGVALLGISGYLGGTMVYNHGVGVELTRAHRVREPDADARDRCLAGEGPVPMG